MNEPLKQEDIDKRLEICRRCEYHGTVPGLKTEFCKACGCPLLRKTKVPTSKCPKGKW
jgi:hypothetical protein